MATAAIFIEIATAHVGIEQFFHVTNAAQAFAKQPSSSTLSRLENMQTALMVLSGNYTEHFEDALEKATADPPLTHEAYCKENGIDPRFLQPQKDFVAALLHKINLVVFQACWGDELVRFAQALGPNSCDNPL